MEEPSNVDGAFNFEIKVENDITVDETLFLEQVGALNDQPSTSQTISRYLLDCLHSPGKVYLYGAFAYGSVREPSDSRYMEALISGACAGFMKAPGSFHTPRHRASRPSQGCLCAQCMT